MSNVVSLNRKEFDLIDAEFEQEAYYGLIDDCDFRPVRTGQRSAKLVIAEREFDTAARLDDLAFLIQSEVFPVTVFLDDGWTMLFDCWCRVYDPGWLDEWKQFTHEPIDPDFRQIAFAYPPRRRAAKLSLMISGNMTATDCRAAPEDGMCDIENEPCPACCGTGNILLLVSEAVCPACGGTGLSVVGGVNPPLNRCGRESPL